MPDGQSVWATPTHTEHGETVPTEVVGHRDRVVGHREDRPVPMYARPPVSRSVEGHDMCTDALEQLGIGTAVEPRSGRAVKKHERSATRVAPCRPRDDSAVGSLDRSLRQHQLTRHPRLHRETDYRSRSGVITQHWRSRPSCLSSTPTLACQGMTRPTMRLRIHSRTRSQPSRPRTRCHSRSHRRNDELGASSRAASIRNRSCLRPALFLVAGSFT